MLNKLIKALEQSHNYIVIGDVMLDQYIIGDVNRMSPEAPVPVLAVNNRTNTAGGAANVAANLVALNAKVKLLGYTGKDEAHRNLNQILSSRGIDFITATWERSTITKTRLVSQWQQIARIDDEKPDEPSSTERKSLQNLIKMQNFSSLSGILLSDYGKGVCDTNLCRLILQVAKERNIPVFVDPKNRDWEKYRGATILTPNVNELSEAIGYKVSNSNEEIEQAGHTLLKKYDLENLVITRSAKGMTLIGQNTCKHFPTMAKDVFDVSGAGDTVLACLARIITAKFDITEAIYLANLAAGVVVGHNGTYPITKDGLLQALTHDKRAESENKKGQDGNIVFTNGCFDILHPGHVEYLQEARKLGGCLIIGLNSDSSVRKIKGSGRPINNQHDRKKMLEALSCVDRVEIFDEETPYNLIRKIAPDILVKGGDYRVEDIVGSEFAGTTITIPFREGYSTTSILEKIERINE